MNRRNIPRLLALIFCGISVWNASANGFGLASQDGFATARGEAFVATADNASAIYYNPAGITQLEGSNLRGGLYGIYLDPSFTPPPPANTNTFHIGKKYAAVPQLFFTYTPKDSPWSFGLGAYAPYGGNMDWPADTGFRSIATKSSLKYFRINPVVALKLFPNLSIGGGVMVDYGNIDLEAGLRPFDQPPNFYRFEGDGWSVGYNLGVLWQPYKQISLGATFRSATTMTMDGHTEYERQPLIQYTKSPAHADFTFPLTAVVGISYRPTPKWNLEFDADYTDWGSFETITIYQKTYPLGGQPNPLVTLDWQPSWMYEFGVTRYFDSGWHVSAGYVFNETSVPDTYYTPAAADLDRHFFSAGAGYKGKRFDFDVTYQFGYGPAHTVTGSTPSSISGVTSGQNANGTYDFISQAVLVTVGMHF